jgi:hypothetical protein
MRTGSDTLRLIFYGHVGSSAEFLDLFRLSCEPRVLRFGGNQKVSPVSRIVPVPALRTAESGVGSRT